VKTPAPALQVRVIDDPTALEGLAGDWDALAVACARPLSAPAWLLAWWRAMAPPGALLRALAVHEGERLVGLAPFMAVHDGGLVAYRPLGGEDMGIRNTPLAEPGMEIPVARALAAALARSAPRPDVVHLDQVDVTSPWPLLLSRAWPGLFPPRRERLRTASAPTLHLEAPSYEEWLAAKSSNFRQRLRRDARKLAERGAVTAMVATPEELERALEDFQRLHGGRWGEESPLAGEAGHRMMLEAGRALLPEERFRVWTITAEGATITVQIFIAAGGEVTYWNGGWDPEWSSLSPAMLGICAGVEDAFARGERRIDFGEGEHHYKTRLADRDEEIAWIRLFPRDLRYPRVALLTAPARGRRAARAALDRLPAPVRARAERALDRARGRGGEGDEEADESLRDAGSPPASPDDSPSS
jgi:CelD/BcsL family acetyltransferase involved in cellulose biosynthesis